LDSKIQIKPTRELQRINKSEVGLEISYINHIDEQWELTKVDSVILCTGYEYHLPNHLYPLAEQLDCDSDCGMALDAQYRVRWSGARNNSIYGLNMGLLSHGIVDPQMSLNAVRAATIVNDLSGRAIYQLSSDGYLRWRSQKSQEKTAAA